MARSIKVGSTVTYSSRAYAGKGKVTEIVKKGTGEWFTLAVTDKSHPKGRVTVRRSQLA